MSVGLERKILLSILEMLPLHEQMIADLSKRLSHLSGVVREICPDQYDELLCLHQNVPIQTPESFFASEHRKMLEELVSQLKRRDLQ